MPRYARRDASDYAVDVLDAANSAAASALIGGTFPSSAFYLVPGDTKHGAKLTFTEGGQVDTVTNPPTPDPPAPKTRELTPNQVIDLILAVIGPAGFAACVRSDIDAMVTWRYKMSVARDITKDQAAAGLSIIVASSLMTAEQRAAVLASWPSL